MLDEHLSRRIVLALQARWPGSSQVTLLGLERATDAQLCACAAEPDYVICSKDDDFHRLVAARGYRPKLVRVSLGNATNGQILNALLDRADGIEAALAEAGTGVVVLT